MASSVEEDVAQLGRELVHILAHWALIHGEMGRFVDAVFDNEVTLK